MENDLIFETAPGDMLAGSDTGDTQIAAVTTTEAPFADALARPFDAAQVVVPEGQNVVREPVTPGEIVELPFPADAQFLARIADGNLAIKVGDVTVILQGYVEAAGQTPPVIEAANGQPLDIATILASTDPNIDIQTAAGPAAGPQGADNTGAILTQFGEGAGLGGFTGVGALDATELAGGGIVAQNETLFVAFGAATTAAINNAPVANDDSYLAIMNRTLSVAPGIGLLANDTDADGDTLTVSAVTAPAHGAVTANADGSFNYVPVAGYFGADSFTYTVDDGKGGTSSATVNIYVDALPELAVGDTKGFRNEDAGNTTVDLNWKFVDKDDAAQPTIAVDPTTLPPGVTYNSGTKQLVLNTLGLYDYLSPGETEKFTILFNVTDGHGGVTVQKYEFTVIGAADGGAADAVNDTILTNVGAGVAVTVPEWAMVANDKDSSTEHLTGLVAPSSGLSGASVVGGFTFTDDATNGGTQGVQLTDGSKSTVTIQNQNGGDLTGTTAHEIIVSGSAGDKIDGHGGKDLIFGGGGDDTVIFHNGDTVQGQGDSIASSNALATAATRGDVLVLDHDVNFQPINLTHFDGIETISTAAADGGAGAQIVTIGAATVTTLSDHTITPGLTPGGVFNNEKDAIRIDGDAVDQLYLSISKDGAGTGWVDTGQDVNGYHVYAHETTAGNAATADAYVMVSNAIPVQNVHLNQDQA